MKIVRWIILSLILLGLSMVFPGIQVDGFGWALFACFVIAALNMTAKPVLIILTLPVNILTLGLFTIVINALMILLASAITPGFSVDSFWWAVALSLVLSVVRIGLSSSDLK